MTRSEKAAFEIVDYLKKTRMKGWMSLFTTDIYGRSLSGSINRVLQKWEVLTVEPHNNPGNYTVNYDAPIFNS